MVASSSAEGPRTSMAFMASLIPRTIERAPRVRGTVWHEETGRCREVSPGHGNGKLPGPGRRLELAGGLPQMFSARRFIAINGSPEQRVYQAVVPDPGACHLAWAVAFGL